MEDNIPTYREKDHSGEEVAIENFEDEVETVFEDTDLSDADDDFKFNADMFDDEDDEIDTTIPDDNLFDDDFDIEDEE